MQEKRKIYRIPANFRDGGYILNGMIAKRNAVDAVILGAIGAIIVWALPINKDAELSMYILFVGLFAMIGISGIKGVPVSTYLIDAYHWRKRRKMPYLYNTHSGAYSVSAADLMLSETSLRDTVSGVLDKIKDSMQSDKPDYIEGETFEFAADPELEMLRYAHEKNEEEKEKSQNTAPSNEPDQTENTPAVREIDISDIIDNLMLTDHGEEG